MMRQRIARVISSVLNPFLVSFITIIIIVVLGFAESITGALKWAAIALALSVLPVFAFTVYQARRKKLDSIFPEKQGQRKMIYALASAMAAIGCGVMWWFKAPHLLAVAFTAGLAAIVVFMLINLYWKISLHTAFLSAAAMVLTLSLRTQAAWVFVLLVPLAWSRLELKLHTPAQVITGAVLGAGIITGVLWCFGMVA